MSEPIIDQVRSKYAAAATSGMSSVQPGVRAVAEAFGYTPDELASLPADANLGLSCGNPTATANLRPGEVVVDLGCGAGIDVLLAARKVGPTGKAIGIDMTLEMIERAKRNAEQLIDGHILKNIEFYLSTIDDLPLPRDSVDCLISNCVINLAPEKPAVFREMFRVLKPGGRVSVSDIALKRPLPDELTRSVAAYVGCIAGAITIADYERGLKEAGFSSIQIVDTEKDLNAYAKIENQAACCAPAPAADSLPLAACGSSMAGNVYDGLADLMQKYNVNDYAASVQ